jgi:FixJ family two-component response regulator
MKSNKVIIVDDEPIIRDSLSSWLSAEYEVQSYENGTDFLQALQSSDFEDGTPTCLLLDFQMPVINGVEVQNELRAINCEIPIIFISGNALQQDVIDAWKGGAVDFILKPFTATQISDALQKLFQTNYHSSERDNHQTELQITQREAQVLYLLGQGHQQNEVAQMLGLSLRTIKMYRTFLKNKLNLNNLVALAKYYESNKQSISLLANFNSKTLKP